MIYANCKDSTNTRARVLCENPSRIAVNAPSERNLHVRVCARREKPSCAASGSTGSNGKESSRRRPRRENSSRGHWHAGAPSPADAKSGFAVLTATAQTVPGSCTSVTVADQYPVPVTIAGVFTPVV